MKAKYTIATILTLVVSIIAAYLLAPLKDWQANKINAARTFGCSNPEINNKRNFSDYVLYCNQWWKAYFEKLKPVAENSDPQKDAKLNYIINSIKTE